MTTAIAAPPDTGIADPVTHSGADLALIIDALAGVPVSEGTVETSLAYGRVADSLRIRGAVILGQLAMQVLTGHTTPDEQTVSAIVRVCADKSLSDEVREQCWLAYLYAVEDENAIEDCGDGLHREIARRHSADALAVLTGRDGGQSL